MIDLTVKFEITAADILKLQGHQSPSSFQGKKIKCNAGATSGLLTETFKNEGLFVLHGLERI